MPQSARSGQVRLPGWNLPMDPPDETPVRLPRPAASVSLRPCPPRPAKAATARPQELGAFGGGSRRAFCLQVWLQWRTFPVLPRPGPNPARPRQRQLVSHPDGECTRAIGPLVLISSIHKIRSQQSGTYGRDRLSERLVFPPVSRPGR